MKECLRCGEGSNDEDERFCMSCGSDMDVDAPADVPSTPEDDPREARPETMEPQAGLPPEPAPVPSGPRENVARKSTRPNLVGRLVMPDKSAIMVDHSQRFVGRADLKRHTKKDPAMIARSQFSVCKKGGRYLIKSSHGGKHGGTSLDGQIIKDEAELRKGSEVEVLDIKMCFEV